MCYYFFMDNIQGPNRFNKKQGNVPENIETGKISIKHLGQAIDIDPSMISQACAKAAKNAYDLCETNDEEKYAEDMEEMLEDILYEKAGKKRPVKKTNPN